MPAPNMSPAACCSRLREIRKTWQITPDELDATCAQLATLFERRRTYSLEWIWKVGIAMKAGLEGVQDSRELKDCFSLLTKALNVPEGLLENAWRIVLVYDEKSFGELADNPAFFMSHVMSLVNFDEDERKELENEIRDEGLSVRELNKRILERFGRRRKPGAGRQPAIPSNPTRALNNMQLELEKLVRRCDDIWFGERFDFVQN